ncbi:hypothetical protein LTR85_001370 [Meristemomyces frigidus]|nr:hypothetical protein LTR85_001370 [Meristemomyces frigidus]
MSDSDHRASDSAPSACSLVFSTTELLEQILLSLPMCDLLLAQGINRHFKTIIDSSVAIQRALYFIPGPCVEKDGTVALPAINPLLRKQTHVTSAPVISSGFGSVRRPLLVFVDAVVASYSSSDPTASPAFKASVTQYDVCRAKQPSIVGVSGATKCYARGSWRRMLATQPPCPLDIGGGLFWPREQRAGTLETMGNVWPEEDYMDGGCRTVKEYVGMVEAGRVVETWKAKTTRARGPG